jgi:FkbM family methyltransferase
MNIEFATDLLCQRFLQFFDPEAAGAVVEVGLGSGNFSFEWATPLGHRCLAVEPLPTEALLTAATEHRVELIQAAMGAASGQVPIYHGELHGHALPDISSLNPRWWGVSNRYTIVPVVTLPDLCASKGVERISLLKVDTEGSESEILRLLSILSTKSLPRLIVLEYGGGGTLRSGEGGWSPEFLGGTKLILETLKKLNYCSCIILERQCLLPIYKTGQHALKIRGMFDPDFQVGNLILIHQNEDELAIAQLLGSARFRLLLSSFEQRVRKNVLILKDWLARAKRKIGLDP